MCRPNHRVRGRDRERETERSRETERGGGTRTHRTPSSNEHNGEANVSCNLIVSDDENTRHGTPETECTDYQKHGQHAHHVAIICREINTQSLRISVDVLLMDPNGQER
jgi:hypothetical protein